MVVQDLVCNYARVYLTLKNPLRMNLEEVGENKAMAEEKLNLEEVSRDVEKTYLNDSMRTGPNSIEKGDGKEQDCNLGRILERDCVFVEFRRTEASCMAGHCLHGKVI
jgi:splicing factor U2AF subunit